MKVKWTYPAGRELIEIREYIGGDNPQAAQRVASSIKAASKRLRALPAREARSARRVVRGRRRRERLAEVAKGP